MGNVSWFERYLFISFAILFTLSVVQSCNLPEVLPQYPQQEIDQ